MAEQMKHINDTTLIKTEAYIGGKWVHGSDKATFEVRNPSTGKVLVNVADLTAAQTEKAIGAARQALGGWQSLTGKERAAVLRRWFDLIMEHQVDLGALMTYEQGKPLAEAKGEVAYGASFIEWFAEEAKRVTGDLPAPVGRDQRIAVLKQPIGVCAAITPWNFPIAMITRKAAPALAAGNTMVLKPASETPLCALALAELAERAGLPAGVLNVVTSSHSGEVGKVLCASQDVRHLSFTGSTNVGRVLMEQCGQTVKRLALELGGHAPFIVFDDADLDAAVDGAIASKYRNAGQTCVCANRIYVQRGVHDEFVEKLAAKVSQLRVGDGFADGVTIGPLISATAVQKVRAHLQDAMAKGAKIRAGAAPTEGNRLVEPIVLSGASSDMLLAHEETFGPLAPVFVFDDDAQAVAMANDSEFGLASYVYTNDLNRYWRISEQLEYGIVGINTGLISNEVGPFGGVKQSGFGREGSRHGMDEYLSMKYLCLGGVR
ncbi:NAD-dependent succinate-semialdehyde dehydrogenase [Cumulibacter soli]|uniref:NAD-dependent succinate-semialdehyde dehydrogenase n=1 Tax=Cumulibacter soli TaxID=2546344 RepID=UPI001067B114|nr:NAD-dependent succinate-semialdehyde dehydrogenase [Cumulibacter soli]